MHSVARDSRSSEERDCLARWGGGWTLDGIAVRGLFASVVRHGGVGLDGAGQTRWGFGGRDGRW